MRFSVITVKNCENPKILLAASSLSVRKDDLKLTLNTTVTKAFNF